MNCCDGGLDTLPATVRRPNGMSPMDLPNNYVPSVAVVVPTRNRPELLRQLLSAIDAQTIQVHPVVVIDSSDAFQPLTSDFRCRPMHCPTLVRSASVQRNEGLEMLLELADPKYIAFLDDDVLPAQDYIERLTAFLDVHPDVAGISGVALSDQPGRTPPRGVMGYVRCACGLDSRRDGALTRGGLNIGIDPASHESRHIDVDWLIGCSVWRTALIRDLRFELDFLGYSLAEDVVFSQRARERGRLVVDSQTVLHHDEADEGRPSDARHWALWIINRLRVVQVAPNGRLAAYWGANAAALVLSTVAWLLRRPRAGAAMRGIATGIGAVLVGKRG